MLMMLLPLPLMLHNGSNYADGCRQFGPDHEPNSATSPSTESGSESEPEPEPELEPQRIRVTQCELRASSLRSLVVRWLRSFCAQQLNRAHKYRHFAARNFANRKPTTVQVIQLRANFRRTPTCRLRPSAERPRILSSLAGCWRSNVGRSARVSLWGSVLKRVRFNYTLE